MSHNIGKSWDGKLKLLYSTVPASLLECEYLATSDNLAWIFSLWKNYKIHLYFRKWLRRQWGCMCCSVIEKWQHCHEDNLLKIKDAPGASFLSLLSLPAYLHWLEPSLYKLSVTALIIIPITSVISIIYLLPVSRRTGTELVLSISGNEQPAPDTWEAETESFCCKWKSGHFGSQKLNTGQAISWKCFIRKTQTPSL